MDEFSGFHSFRGSVCSFHIWFSPVFTGFHKTQGRSTKSLLSLLRCLQPGRKKMSHLQFCDMFQKSPMHSNVLPLMRAGLDNERPRSSAHPFTQSSMLGTRATRKKSTLKYRAGGQARRVNSAVTAELSCAEKFLRVPQHSTLIVSVNERAQIPNLIGATFFSYRVVQYFGTC